MTKKLFRRIFPLVAFLLLAPWPIAYTASYSSDTVPQDGIQVSAAEVSAAPTWTAVEKTIGGVTPGDLFFIDATDSGADIQATLHFTNTSELVDSYRYLILKVGLYVDSGNGEWEPAYGVDGELAPDTFITLRNGYAASRYRDTPNTRSPLIAAAFIAPMPISTGAAPHPSSIWKQINNRNQTPRGRGGIENDNRVEP